MLGTGILESAYSFCLKLELENMGLKYVYEAAVPLVYRGKNYDCSFRQIFWLNQVIVELKAVESYHQFINRNC